MPMDEMAPPFGKKSGDVGMSTMPDMDGEKPEKSDEEMSSSPEDAMEKALREGTPEAAIERLRTSGYKLVKIDDAGEKPDGGGFKPFGLSNADRLGAARRAMSKEKT